MLLLRNRQVFFKAHYQPPPFHCSTFIVWSLCSEVVSEPRIHAARWGNRGSREEAGEVDHVQTVRQILASNLKSNRPAFPFPYAHCQTCIEGEVRANSSGIEIHFVDDLLAVLLGLGMGCHCYRPLTVAHCHIALSSLSRDVSVPNRRGELITFDCPLFGRDFGRNVAVPLT
jgi:hypothetical protein